MSPLIVAVLVFCACSLVLTIFALVQLEDAGDGSFTTAGAQIVTMGLLLLAVIFCASDLANQTSPATRAVHDIQTPEKS